MPAGHCRNCGYALTGLAEARCPECGRPFDPADPKSFDRSPRRRHVRRWTRIGVVLFVLAAIVSSPVVWVYAGWRREQAAIARHASIYYVQRAPCGPAWVSRLLGPRAYWLDRVSQIAVRQTAHGDSAFVDLAQFGRLRKLDVDFGPAAPLGRAMPSVPPNDDDFTCLDRLTGLTEVSFSGVDCGDATLARLGRLSRLKTLELAAVHRSTPAGWAAFAGSSRLQTLFLADVAIDDAGVCAMNFAAKTDLHGLELHQHYAFGVDSDWQLSPPPDRMLIGDIGVGSIAAPALRQLTLSGLHITDDAFDGLGHATHLRALIVNGSAISGAKLDRLAKLPDLGVLDLDGSEITDDGLKQLPTLPNLQSIKLGGTLTDEGLMTLLRLPSLNYVDVPDGSTSVGVARVSRAIAERREAAKP